MQKTVGRQQTIAISILYSVFCILYSVFCIFHSSSSLTRVFVLTCLCRYFTDVDLEKGFLYDCAVVPCVAFRAPFVAARIFNDDALAFLSLRFSQGEERSHRRAGIFLNVGCEREG